MCAEILCMAVVSRQHVVQGCRCRFQVQQLLLVLQPRLHLFFFFCAIALRLEQVKYTVGSATVPVALEFWKELDLRLT